MLQPVGQLVIAFQAAPNSKNRHRKPRFPALGFRRIVPIILMRGGTHSALRRSETQRSEMEISMALQLALPLEAGSRKQNPLRQAWLRSGLALPYELALQDRALAICLRCLADAMHRKHRRKRRG